MKKDKKNLLVVVDMQNDFINGSLGTLEAQAIVPNVASKIKQYLKNENSLIVFTYDTHDENYMETQEGKNLPVPHCIVGTQGWELHPEIDELRKNSKNTVLRKPTFGCVNLPSFLNIFLGNRDMELETIELVGLCTDICVVSNALILKAYYPEIKITVDSNCCAGVTPESHESALTTMKMCQINVI